MSEVWLVIWLKWQSKSTFSVFYGPLIIRCIIIIIKLMSHFSFFIRESLIQMLISPVVVFSQHLTYLTSCAKWTKSFWEKFCFALKIIIQWIVNAVCLLSGRYRRVRSASSSHTRDGRRTTSLQPALLKSFLLPKASRWPLGPHVCQVTCFSHVIGQKACSIKFDKFLFIKIDGFNFFEN